MCYDAEMRKEDMKHVHKIKKREASYKSHHKAGERASLWFERLLSNHRLVLMSLVLLNCEQKKFLTIAVIICWTTY